MFLRRPQQRGDRRTRSRRWSARAARSTSSRPARSAIRSPTLKRVQAQHYVQGASADHGRARLPRSTTASACVQRAVLPQRHQPGLARFLSAPADRSDAGGGARRRSSRSTTSTSRCRARSSSAKQPDECELLADDAVERKRPRGRDQGERAQRARAFLDLARQATRRPRWPRGSPADQTMRERFESLRDLLELDETPQRIECFDISHTMGEATVASCVVFGPEGAGEIAVPPLQHHRHHAGRRLRRHASGARTALSAHPGGRGHVAGYPADRRRQGPGRSRRCDVLVELGVTGVLGRRRRQRCRARAPDDETLIRGDNGKTLWPGPESPALHLIQTVRDEAHRFAITGHRGRREKAREKSRPRGDRRASAPSAARRCSSISAASRGVADGRHRGTDAGERRQPRPRRRNLRSFSRMMLSHFAS